MRLISQSLLFCSTAIGLSLVLAAPIYAQSEATAALENTSWQLLEIRSANGFVQTPENSEDYLFRFRLNNRAEIQAHCNAAGATWQLDGDSLSITDLVTTRKLCLPPSLFNFYIMHLGNVQSINVDEERLILTTGPVAVELEFEPYIYRPQF